MLNWIKSVFGVLRIIQEMPAYFAFFLIVNLFFGAMGLWLPPALAANDVFASPIDEVIKAIRQGNGYLFSLPLLAGSSMYLFREYRESKSSEFKDIKLLAAIITLALMIIMGLSLAQCVTSQFDIPLDSSLHQKRVPIGIFGISFQVFLTVASLILATLLFCLEQIDDYQEYGKGLKDKTRKKLTEQMDSAENDSGLKL